MLLKAAAKPCSLQGESLLMPHRAKSFAWAAQFLPATIKNDLNILYSFCRYVDDSADRCTNKARAWQALEQVSKDLELESSTTFEVQQFLNLSQRRAIPKTFALELTKGVKADISQKQMHSEEELLRYCYQVAGTVGVMICHLLGVKDKNAVAAGIDLAIAMQLTNIARDVHEDLEQGRIYLPANLISWETVSASFSNDETAQYTLLLAIKHIIAIAKTYYRSADNGICFLPPSTRIGILLASRAYEKIGQLIISNPKRYFRERISTGTTEKILCLCETLGSLASPRYHRVKQAPAHRSELHQALRGLPSFDVVFA
jgi:phytoene synthase